MISANLAGAADSPLMLSPATSKVLPMSVAPQTVDFHASIGKGGRDVTAQIQQWLTSNPDVATVTGTGHLVGLTPGSATITARLGGLRATAEVTVLDACLMTLPSFEAACSSSYVGCTDADGDGLGDAWETAGGIDFDGDGVVDDSERVLTNVDPLFPDGSANPHPSAEPGTKDVFLKYDWMELPDQFTNGQPTACTLSPPPDIFKFVYPYHSDDCAFDQACVDGICRGHSDAPDAASLMAVIDAFAAHGVRLHLVRGHALAHSNVLSFGSPGSTCIADTSAQTFSGSQAGDFYALKAANFNATYNASNFSADQLRPFMHYAIFAHRHSCDSPEDCAQPECVNPDTGVNPRFNETGLAETPGNDIIISLGQFRDSRTVLQTIVEGGTFMHELGHNLGLDHGGPRFINGIPQGDQVRLNFKPNYLSVMNYNHQWHGISTASADCAADDYVCKTTPVSVRIDYSSFANGVVPNTLDENQGSEAAGINLGNNDIAYNSSCNGPPRPVPGTGPVDWDCNGVLTDTWCPSGCTHPFFELNANDGRTPDGTPGSGDVLLPFEDWPNLVFSFQCEGTFDDGAVGNPGYGASLPAHEMTVDEALGNRAGGDEGGVLRKNERTEPSDENGTQAGIHH
jgi:hypothetical protein